MENWNLIKPFLGNQYKKIFIDLRGSGRSQQPSGSYTIELMGKDVQQLLNYLKIDSAYFIGHSMGGAIVQQLCIDFPAMVKKAIICSSFPKVPMTSLMQIDTVLEMALAEICEEFIYKTVLPWLYSSDCLEKKGGIEYLIKQMSKNPFPQKPEGFIGQGAALKGFNILDQLKKIQAPCMILVGENDLYAPISCSKELEEKIPDTKLKIFSGQGHMINEEIPQLLAEEILSFLSTD